MLIDEQVPSLVFSKRKSASEGGFRCYQMILKNYPPVRILDTQDEEKLLQVAM
jgi:hypothetical protein